MKLFVYLYLLLWIVRLSFLQFRGQLLILLHMRPWIFWLLIMYCVCISVEKMGQLILGHNCFWRLDQTAISLFLGCITDLFEEMASSIQSGTYSCASYSSYGSGALFVCLSVCNQSLFFRLSWVVTPITADSGLLLRSLNDSRLEFASVHMLQNKTARATICNKILTCHWLWPG